MRNPFRIAILAAVGIASAAAGPLAGAAPAKAKGFLGAAVAPAEEGHSGVVVRDVTPGSPAATAGLKAGDRVVKVGDKEVKDAEGFLSAVAAHKPGDKLSLTVERDGKTETLTATLGDRPARRPELLAPPDARPQAYLGVQMIPLAPDLRKQLGVETESGVVVAGVADESPAAKAGLRKDDVITAANGQPVRAPEDLRDAVLAAGVGKELALSVSRGDEKLSLKTTLQAAPVGSFFTPAQPFFLPPGQPGFPAFDFGVMPGEGRRVRELERRIEELEKRLRELEQKSGPSK